MEIIVDDLSGGAVLSCLREYLRDMHPHSPPESVHALDLEGLRQPGVTFWTVWEAGELIGCGSLKEVDAAHGEIKSMRTARFTCERWSGAGCWCTSWPKHASAVIGA